MICKVVLLSLLIVVCYGQTSCSSFKVGEYICSFDDFDQDVPPANNILLTIVDDEEFTVESNNPDCRRTPPISGDYDIDGNRVIFQIHSSCGGPASLFDDNDDQDVLVDYTIPSTCDAFSGTIEFKGFLSCEFNFDDYEFSSDYFEKPEFTTDFSTAGDFYLNLDTPYFGLFDNFFYFFDFSSYSNPFSFSFSSSSSSSSNSPSSSSSSSSLLLVNLTVIFSSLII